MEGALVLHGCSRTCALIKSCVWGGKMGNFTKSGDSGENQRVGKPRGAWGRPRPRALSKDAVPWPPPSSPWAAGARQPCH